MDFYQHFLNQHMTHAHITHQHWQVFFSKIKHYTANESLDLLIRAQAFNKKVEKKLMPRGKAWVKVLINSER